VVLAASAAFAALNRKLLGPMRRRVHDWHRHDAPLAAAAVLSQNVPAR
jgi:hypothetical protein